MLLASFPRPAQLSVTCSTESWAGPGNEASMLLLKNTILLVSIHYLLCQISRARVLYSKLTSENHAVTVIAAHFRGYWQRKKYKELKRRHYAAIKIQAFIR